jgi:hypothetical protein
MPVRKIKKSYRSVTGVMTSRKTGRMVASESTLERDLFTLLEFDPSVEKFEEQPLRITYKGINGKDHSYTPDAICYLKTQPLDYRWRGSLFFDFFEYSAGIEKYRLKPLSHACFLSEVKYRQDFFDKWTELKPKLKAARAASKEMNARFKIFTEIELRTPVLENVKFLRRFRHRLPQPEDSRKMMRVISDLDQSYPNEILKHVAGDNRSEIARQIPVLWYLVANFHVEMDWFQPLNMRTKLFSI